MPSASSTPAPTPSPATPWWNSRWAVYGGALLLAGLLCIAYYNSFKVPYILDDEDSIGKNETIRSFATAFFPPGNSGITVSGRPLLNFTLAINYKLHGTEILGYHIGNLLIHFAAALALFGVVRRTLLRPVLADRFGAHATPLALAAAAMWALHPLQTESVTYIVQRAESLVGLCYLFTTYAFIRSIEAPSRKWTIITIASCFLGMAAKEVMATAPLILFLYDRTFVSGSFAEAWRQRRKLHLWLVSGWLLLLACIISTGGGRGSTVGFSQVSIPEYVQTQIPAICRYLRLAFWPTGLTFDYGAVIEQQMEVIVPAVFILIPILAAVAYTVVRKPLLGFVGAWIFVILGPTSSIIPVATQLVAEHRMYTSLAALATGFVLLLYVLNRKYSWWAMTAITAILCVLTINRNAVYSSGLSIWEDTVKKAPVSVRALTNLGAAYLVAGRTQDAVRAYGEAVELIPDAWSLTNLAIALTKLGEIKEGLSVLERAVKLRPNLAQYHAIYGNALMVSEKYEQSFAELRQAVSLEPQNASFRFDLANAYSKQDRYEEAEAEYKEVLRLTPKDVEAMTNYGALLRRMGKTQESIALLEKALSFKPKIGRIHSNLGVALLETGRKEEAVQHLLEALKYEPALGQAHYNLACYFAEHGKNAEAIHHFEELFKVEKPTAEALSNLAVIYARADRLKDALATLKRALEVDPNHATARANFERIDAYLKENPEP